MARPENKTWGIGNHKLKFSPDSNQNVLVHDFKSKKVSTTVSRVDPHQASQLFKNKINFKAKKNTFDATHMDEILRSEFSRFATSNNFIRTFKKKPKYERPKEDSIRKFKFNDVGKIHLDIRDRPSASFLTPTRNKVMISSYVDEADVSSVLMPNESLTVDISRNKDEIVNESKNTSFNVLPSLQKYPNLMTQDNTINKSQNDIQSPFSRRQELNAVKAELEQFNSLKTKLKFCVKKERLLRNLYRHGVLGIQKCPDTVKKDHFYSDQEAMVKMQREKQIIQQKRMIKLKGFNGVSEQINTLKNQDISRKDDKIVDIFQSWTKKKVSAVRFENTHESLFMPSSTSPNADRYRRLINESTKGRRYNILTNGNNTPVDML